MRARVETYPESRWLVDVRRIRDPCYGLNRLVQAAYPGTYGTWSWAYDSVGKWTPQTAPSGQTVYTYDQNNRLTQAGAVVYSCDQNGNLTGTSAGQSLTYDPFNRMTQVVGTGGSATYTYNGDGLKVQRVGPDGATRYYYDGIRPIWETDGAGAMAAQLDRDIFGNLLSRAEPGGRRYYHTDGLGSTVTLTDETGAIAASMLYVAGMLLAAIQENAIQYGDVNVGRAYPVWGPISAGFTGGVIVTASGEIHPYFGVMISTPGFSGTITISAQEVTTGWNIAVSGVIPLGPKGRARLLRGYAIQIGTALDCFSTCGYREFGAGTPGFAAMLFYVR